MSQVLGASPCPILHLLEPSTISYKAACLQFRHHLHINAARELVGKHLMWRQQLLQIFIILHPHPLSSICPSPCRKIPLIYYIKGMGMFLATSDRSSEMNILLGYSQIHHKFTLPLSIIQCLSLPQLIVLGYVLVLGLGYWAIGPTLST